MKKQKGFTLIEVLLAIVVLGIFLGVALVAMRPMTLLNKLDMFRVERDMNAIFQAIRRYDVATEGQGGLGITTERREICLESESCTLKADISTLLPSFLSSIPQSPFVEDGSGYYIYLDENDGVVIETESESDTIMSLNGRLVAESEGGTLSREGTWYGYNLWGQFGSGSQGLNDSHEVMFEQGLSQIELGDRTTGYIDSDGRLFTAGAGPLGTGELIQMSYQQVSGEWSVVSFGDGHALGIDEQGHLWGWGNNHSYQILSSGTAIHATPVLIDSSRVWTGVEVANTSSFAWTNDGELYSWGMDFYGLLGQESSLWDTVPTRIGNETWESIDIGDGYVIGIQSDGSLWSWGRNHGQGNLGYSMAGISQTTPRLIDNSRVWTQVSAGDTHAVALDQNSQMFVWGSNSEGELGLGDSTDRFAPTQVTGLWSDIAAGGEFTLGITDQNQLRGWGSDQYGALTGANPFYSVNIPTDFGFDDVIDVEAANRYSWIQN